MELLGGVVLPGQRLQLLLPLGRLLDPPLVRVDLPPQALLLGLEGLGLGIEVGEHLLEATQRRAGRPRRAVRIRPAERALEGRDLRLHPHHLRIPVGEALAQLDQLRLEPRQPGHGRVGTTGRDLEVAELLRQRRPPLHGPELAFGVLADQRAQPLQDGEPLGELAAMALLELLELPFLFVQLGRRRLELRLEELRRRGRLPPADPQVLLDVRRREGVGDLGHRPGIRSAVAERERDRRAPHAGLAHLARLQLDVLSHSLDRRLRRLHSQLRVEPEAGDQLLEPCAAQHFLAYGVEPGLELVGPEGASADVGRSDHRLRHLLGLYEDGRRRPIEIGH